MKQVLKSPNKSTMITDLINNYPQKMQHTIQKGNLERHEVSKIEDRVQCQKCFKYQRPGETFVLVNACYKAFTEEVKKQAEQRISSRFIMRVPGIHH